MRRASRFAAVAAAAIVAAGCLSACQGLSSPARHTYAATTATDDEFQRRANQPPNARTLFGLARLLVAQGRDEEAQPILQRLLTENPRFVAAYVELAELHMRNQRLGEAVNVLQVGLQHAPDDPVMLNNLGLCWLLREDFDGAAHYFTKAVARDPNNARFRGNLAAALGKQGRYDEALAIFSQVVKKSDAHHNVAVLAEARGDFERAKVEYAAAKRQER